MFLEVVDRSKRGFREKVRVAACRFYSRYQEFPNLVFVPKGEKPERVWQVKVEVGETKVVVRGEEKKGLAEADR